MQLQKMAVGIGSRVKHLLCGGDTAHTFRYDGADLRFNLLYQRTRGMDCNIRSYVGKHIQGIIRYSHTRFLRKACYFTKILAHQFLVRINGTHHRYASTLQGHSKRSFSYLSQSIEHNTVRRGLLHHFVLSELPAR